MVFISFKNKRNFQSNQRIIVFWLYFKIGKSLKKQPTVLVCPLDWGIGHATRCVPVIRELLSQRTRVIIGASNRPLAFLQKEFPHLEFIDFPGYQIKYPSDKSGMVLKMARQIPTLLKSIRDEHSFLNKIISSHKVDLVISDNRYGLYTNKIPCVFMTHQVFIKMPAALRMLEPLLSKVNRRFMKRYTECWIPDVEDEPNLSGDLSHGKVLPKHTFFIGPLSRFKLENSNKPGEYAYDVLVLLSGPEPQRTILENKIMNSLSALNLRAAMVCGKPEELTIKTHNQHIDIYQHLESDPLRELILQSEIVISRPGYSTIMDLAALGKKALFIPTPGQTEQEYLSRYFTRRKLYFSISQHEINLENDLKKSLSFQGIYLENDFQLLRQRIAHLLSKC